MKINFTLTKHAMIVQWKTDGPYVHRFQEMLAIPIIAQCVQGTYIQIARIVKLTQILHAYCKKTAKQEQGFNALPAYQVMQAYLIYVFNPHFRI